MAIYDSIDLRWTWDGDYITGDDGDIADTRDDLLESFRTELHSVLRSEFNDWEMHPNLGANISEFRGEPNTRETGDALKSRIIGRLVASGNVQASDLDVRIVPVGKSQVLCILTINATATPGNELQVGQPLVTHFLYDSLEDSVFFLEESKITHDFRTS